MELEKAFLEYWKFMKKKWSSEKTISKYYNQVKKVFIYNNKLWKNRNQITEKEIEKYIKSNKKRTQNTI